MNRDSYRCTTCILCQSDKLTPVLILKPTPIADEYLPKKSLYKQPLYPLTLVMCEACGHVQLSDIVSPKKIYIHYIFKTTSSPGLVKHFETYADDVVQKLKPKKQSLVIEIGSNDGSLLKAFKTHDLRVLGIDPARDIATQATKEGIKTIPEFFSSKLAQKISKSQGDAMIICANNVLANIDDLTDFFSGIKLLLHQDGVFIFESFYLGDVIKNMVFDFIFHEHMSYFSVAPLQKFFRSLDLELFDVQHVDTKGGSIRYFVQRHGGPHNVTSHVQAYIQKEKRMGLQSLKQYKTFAKNIDIQKRKLLKTLSKLKNDHKTVAGYGASATTTTMLYHFDLTDKIQLLYDENPLKFDSFSPGAHIPVYSSQKLMQDPPDYLVIFAWRYADRILKQLDAYQKHGGHIIIPLPHFNIL